MSQRFRPTVPFTHETFTHLDPNEVLAMRRSEERRRRRLRRIYAARERERRRMMKGIA